MKVLVLGGTEEARLLATKLADLGHEVVSSLAGKTKNPILPQGDAVMTVTSVDGRQRRVTLTLRIDTAIEVDYYFHGGILPFVLRQLLAA